MGRTSTLLVLSYMLWITSALTTSKRTITSKTVVSANVLPPSQDPFYTEPYGYENAAPGAVLRVRSAQGLAKVVVNCTAAYQILYRTTDSNYQPSWAVTTLLVGQTDSANSTTNSTTGASGSILLSYQDAYDSPNIDDSPSYDTYFTSVDPAIPIGLGRGWYVNLPDYEGPLASFTAGVQSGHATIDSIRAVLNSGFGLHNQTKYAMYGYSGGAAASEWAAELQVQYAPEMTFAGMAIGGVTPNVTSVIKSIDGTQFAEVNIGGALGLTSQDPAARKYLVSQLKTSGPYNKTGFLAALTQNTSVDAVEYANTSFFDFFVNGAAIIQNPLIQDLVNRDGIMGYHGTPAMPVFVFKAIGDEFSPIADTDALVERYCAVGANILYQRNTVGGHLAEAINETPNALAFLIAILEGSYASTYNTRGCTIKNVTITTDTSPL